MNMGIARSGGDSGERPATAGQAVKVAPDSTGRAVESGTDPATQAMSQALKRASQLGQPLVDLG
jgi:hypothetical protein